MKLALVVQRYGSEVLGGAEHLCRLLAERLAPQHEVDVLTTCARDYVTWRNEYPEGADRIRGVTVRRFATTRTRDIEAFNRHSEWVFNNPHTAADEQEWLRQQGIEVTGQMMTGSGNMLRYRLRLIDGFELDLVIEAETLFERPQLAIDEVEAKIARHEEERWRTSAC